jgi:putative transposase
MPAFDRSLFNLVFEPRQPIELNGTRLFFKGKTRDGQGTLIFEDRHGLPHPMTPREFLENQEARRLRMLTPAEVAAEAYEHPGGRPRVGFDSSNREQDAASVKDAQRKLRYIAAWERAGCPSRTPEKLGPIVHAVAETFGDPRPPCARQAIRWIEDWLKFGRDPAMLVSQTPNCGNYVDKLPAKARALLEEVVNETYLTDQRLTGVAVHKHVEAEFGKHNAALPKSDQLSVPSLNSVYAQIRKIDAFTRDFCRLGKHVAEHRHRLLKSGPVTAAHHERWEIDHTTVDCLAINGKTGPLIGRPTITVIIDRHTRMIMGFHISFDGPCTSATMACLRMAILPKESLLARYSSIKGTWPCFGKALVIVPDNAADFRSASFVEACLRLGTDVDYPPVLKAWYKGTIERFFRKLAVDVFHRMPGTTFSNFYERNKETTPEMAAVVTLAELEFYVLQYIVDVYSVRKHRGLDRPPIAAWNESVAAHGLLPPPDPDQLAADLTEFEYRTIQREGIAYDGLNYRSEALAVLRVQPNRPKLVKIKIDPLEVTRIWFIDPFDNQPKEAFVDPAKRKLVEGVTWEKYRLARAIQRNNPENFGGEEGLANAYVLLDQDMAKKTGAKGKADRRKAAAYFNKLTSAAKSEEPPAFDVGRSATSIIEHAFDGGGADVDMDGPNALGAVVTQDPVLQPAAEADPAPPVDEVAHTRPKNATAKYARPKKATTKRAPDPSPRPTPAADDDEDDFDPETYARLNGLSVHRNK